MPTSKEIKDFTDTYTGKTSLVHGDLHPAVYCNATAPVDFSDNPQIVDGFDGQEVIFMGMSDTNYILFEEGNGLSLEGDSTCTLGLEDILTLKYSETFDLWIEQGRSRN